MRKAIIAVMALLLLIPVAATAQNNPPVADAGEDQTMYLGYPITLYGSATDPDDDLIRGWQWEVISAPSGSNYSLADAATPNALFTTNMIGDYFLTLIAWDGLLWSDPDAVVVVVVENQPPTAIADATPLSGPTPLTVHFDGTASFDPEGGGLFYDWNFGDLTFGTGANPTHEYTDPGTYAAFLIVTDDFGNDDFDTIYITVDEPPPAWGEASVVGMQSSSPSKGLNCLIGLLIPLGAVLLLKGLRRR